MTIPLWLAGMVLGTACLYCLCTLTLLTTIQTPWECLLLGATPQNLTKYSVHGYLTHYWWPGIKWNKFVCVCVRSKQTKISKLYKSILDSHILSFWQLTSHYQQFFHPITQTEHLQGTRNYNECYTQTKPVQPHNCPMTVSPLYKHFHFTDEETEV